MTLVVYHIFFGFVKRNASDELLVFSAIFRYNFGIIKKREKGDDDVRDCYIVGAGDFDGIGFSPRAEDLVIAADGGYLHLRQLGISADVIVGDFDSAPEPKHPHIVRYDAVKDDTDLHLAVDLGLEYGCKRFFLFGGTGGRRMDHTLASIQTLGHLRDQGAEGYLIGNGMVSVWLREERLLFPAGYRGYLSVFSIGQSVRAVTLQGLKYTLDGDRLTNTRPMGVSNAFLGEPAVVEIRGGEALVLWARQEQPLPVRERLC